MRLTRWASLITQAAVAAWLVFLTATTIAVLNDADGAASRLESAIRALLAALLPVAAIALHAAYGRRLILAIVDREAQARASALASLRTDLLHAMRAQPRTFAARNEATVILPRLVDPDVIDLAERVSARVRVDDD